MTTPDAGSRTERKRADRMARIERTAARLFAEKGYDRANLDDIAAELDLRGSSLYHYFSSKDDLFLRCLRSAADTVFGRLRAIIAAEPDPTTTLRALIREQVLVETRDLPEFVPLFFGLSVPVPELRDEILRLRREHARIFQEVIARVDPATQIPAAERRIWLGIAYGAIAYLHQWYDPAGALGPVEVADRMAETLMGAFPAPSPGNASAPSRTAT